MKVILIVVSYLLAGVFGTPTLLEDEIELPEDFLIGAGLSAAQAEGAWNASGKAESLVDRLVRNVFRPNTIDVAADHYHRYEEDLNYAKEMKFTTHRFSMSWSRILPTADKSKPNKDGVEFYRKYIKKIIENGMTPLVTMLHFDQPFELEKRTSGWNSAEMVEKFVEYADFLFETFGSEVKYWTTINEGNMYCNYFPQIASYIGLDGMNDSNFYQCLKNMAIAQAKVYRLYKEKYFADQKGQVGASALLWPATPVTPSYDDVIAADILNQIFAGVLLYPIVHGDYPQIVRYIVDKRSSDQGLKESRLPKFNEDDRKLFEDGPVADFVAINVYSGFKVAYDFNITDGKDFPALLGPCSKDMMNVKLVSGGASFDTIDVNLMRDAILWTWNNFHLPIIVSENGLAVAGMQDTPRINYHSINLRSVVRTMKEYKIPVLAYYAWALIDVFEFSAGYTDRPFGLVHVDYSSKNLTRTPKDSAKFFRKLAETRKIPNVISAAASTLFTSTLLSITTSVLAFVVSRI